MGLFELKIPEGNTLPQENTLRNKSEAKALQLIASHTAKVATVKKTHPKPPQKSRSYFRLDHKSVQYSKFSSLDSRVSRIHKRTYSFDIFDRSKLY